MSTRVRLKRSGKPGKSSSGNIRVLIVRPLSALQDVSCGVLTSQCHQLLVSPTFEDPPIIEINDQIGLFDGPKVVRNQKSRASFRQSFECRHYLTFILSIQPGRWFVQNDDRGSP